MLRPPGRGLAAVAMVMVALSVLLVAGRVLAPLLAEPPGRSAAPSTGAIRIVRPADDPPEEPPLRWSTVPAAASGKPGRLREGGVQLRLPAGWQGRTTTEGGLLVLQAANFPLATRDGGEDPIKDMEGEQVVVTVSGGGPAVPVSASPTIGASDFLHGGRVPAGRALVEKTVRQHGRLFHISALFGARPPATSLLRQANQLLASLTLLSPQAERIPP